MGEGDRYFPHFDEVDLNAKAIVPILQGRLGQAGTRPRIYQLFVRLFGNCNETRQPNGTLAVNGVGKFGDINDAALGFSAIVRFFSPLADWCPATGDWHRLLCHWATSG